MAYDAEANRISNFALDRIQEIGIEENVDFISNEKIDLSIILMTYLELLFRPMT